MGCRLYKSLIQWVLACHGAISLKQFCGLWKQGDDILMACQEVIRHRLCKALGAMNQAFFAVSCRQTAQEILKYAAAKLWNARVLLVEGDIPIALITCKKFVGTGARQRNCYL